MGKTFRRNDRWKKDRRDQNFKKSKKFKEFDHGGHAPPKSNLPEPETIEPIEIDDSTDS
jgi:hypothetical protein